MAGEIQLNSTSFVSESGGTVTLNSSTDIKGCLNASGSAPIYACRAWVNFRGVSQSGTLNTSGPVTGLYTATVTGATTFSIEYNSTTYTVTASGNHQVGDGEGVDLTISGTSVTIDTQIRGSGNVSSVNDNGVGDYTVNFATAMPDANYCAVTTNGILSTLHAIPARDGSIASYSVSSIRVSSFYENTSSYAEPEDATYYMISIFR